MATNVPFLLYFEGVITPKHLLVTPWPGEKCGRTAETRPHSWYSDGWMLKSYHTRTVMYHRDDVELVNEVYVSMCSVIAIYNPPSALDICHYVRQGEQSRDRMWTRSFSSD